MERREKRVGTGWLLGVGVALLVLTTVTYVLHGLPHGAWSLPVALGIAVVKGVLIALWYMHLKEQRGSNALVPLTAVIFLVVVLVVVVIETGQRIKPTIPPGPFNMEPHPESP